MGDETTGAEGRRHVAGIDVGSTYTKCVLLDGDREVVSRGLVKSGYRFAEAAEEAFAEAADNAGLDEEEVDYVAATGYGRFMIPFREIQITELTCHSRAAHHLFPETRVILDIGGQDIKGIKLDAGGNVKSFRLNDKCAAGTGAFLEKIAGYMDKTTHEIPGLAAEGADPVGVSSTCTVFAESEIINHLAEGESPADIMAGSIENFASRAVNLMRAVGLEPEYTLTGGMTKNPYMVKCLEEELDAPLNVPPDDLGHFSGALGAALMGLSRLEKLESDQADPASLALLDASEPDADEEKAPAEVADSEETEADQRVSELLDECRQVAEDLDYERVQAWKAEEPDRKALGHFQVYFPEEIAHAAGVLPVKLVGGGNRLEAQRADAHIGSFVCSIMRSTLELGLSDRLSFMDMLVTQPICDAARHLAGIWGRTFEDQPAQILYLPQNPSSKASASYLTTEYRRLLDELEELTGRTVTEDDLRESIELYNESRRMMRELYAIRHESPWQISATETYWVLQSATAMPREEHSEILGELLELLPERSAKPQDKVRVVFRGGFCELPPPEMLREIEELCYVVDDDLFVGLRWLTDDVDTAGAPLESLARAYVDADATETAPTQFDERKPAEEIVEEAIDTTHAHGLIGAAAKFCEPGLDDQTAYAQHFDDLDIPCLLVEYEEKQSRFDRFKMEVETFAESILFG